MNEKHEIDGNVKYSFCEKLFHKEKEFRQHCHITNYHQIVSTQPAEPKSPEKPQNILEISMDT